MQVVEKLYKKGIVERFEPATCSNYNRGATALCIVQASNDFVARSLSVMGNF